MIGMNFLFLLDCFSELIFGWQQWPSKMSTPLWSSSFCWRWPMSCSLTSAKSPKRISRITSFWYTSSWMVVIFLCFSLKSSSSVLIDFFRYTIRNTGLRLSSKHWHGSLEDFHYSARHSHADQGRAGPDHLSGTCLQYCFHFCMTSTLFLKNRLRVRSVGAARVLSTGAMSCS